MVKCDLFAFRAMCVFLLSCLGGRALAVIFVHIRVVLGGFEDVEFVSSLTYLLIYS